MLHIPMTSSLKMFQYQQLLQTQIPTVLTLPKHIHIEEARIRKKKKYYFVFS